MDQLKLDWKFQPSHQDKMQMAVDVHICTCHRPRTVLRLLQNVWYHVHITYLWADFDIRRWRGWRWRYWWQGCFVGDHSWSGSSVCGGILSQELILKRFSCPNLTGPQAQCCHNITIENWSWRNVKLQHILSLQTSTLSTFGVRTSIQEKPVVT